MKLERRLSQILIGWLAFALLLAIYPIETQYALKVKLIRNFDLLSEFLNTFQQVAPTETADVRLPGKMSVN